MIIVCVESLTLATRNAENRSFGFCFVQDHIDIVVVLIFTNRTSAVCYIYIFVSLMLLPLQAEQ